MITETIGRRRQWRCCGLTWTRDRTVEDWDCSPTCDKCGLSRQLGWLCLRHNGMFLAFTDKQYQVWRKGGKLAPAIEEAARQRGKTIKRRAGEHRRNRARQGRDEAKRLAWIE